MYAMFDLKSFKHDGSSHRLWRSLALIKEDPSFYYLASDRTRVIEDDGREWRTQQPTLYLLSKDRFFNVICMIKGPDQIDYYVNIASPTVMISDNVLGFIDYDLDLKKSQKNVKKLDLNEYAHNAARYRYNRQLQAVINHTFAELEKKLIDGLPPFVDKENLSMYSLYTESAARS